MFIFDGQRRVSVSVFGPESLERVIPEIESADLRLSNLLANHDRRDNMERVHDVP
jgi:hypothetical protein